MTDLNPEQVRDEIRNELVGIVEWMRDTSEDDRSEAYDDFCAALDRLLDSWLAQGEALAAARKAIENASYYLQPNQGESVNVGAASCWLRTAYPADHVNYLSPEQVIELGFPDVDAALASLSSPTTEEE